MPAPRPAIGTLLGGGPDLLRSRPGAVLVWALIILAGLAGTDLVSRQLFRMSPTGEIGGPSYALVSLLFVLVLPLLLTAALRAMLRPRETEFASIDFGMDELRVIGLCVALIIISALAAGIVGFFTAPLALAAASGSGSGVGITLIAVVVVLVRALVPSLVLAALSLAFPLVLIRRRILLDEAWKLSEGHVWPLFLTYLLILVGMTLLGLAAVAVTDWPGLAASFHGQDPGVTQWVRLAAPVDAMTILFWVFNAARTTLAIVFLAGAMARAARILVPDEEALTETFS